jgi:hypothetical protein
MLRTLPASLLFVVLALVAPGHFAGDNSTDKDFEMGDSWLPGTSADGDGDGDGDFDDESNSTLWCQFYQTFIMTLKPNKLQCNLCLISFPLRPSLTIVGKARVFIHNISFSC